MTLRDPLTQERLDTLQAFQRIRHRDEEAEAERIRASILQLTSPRLNPKKRGLR